MNKYIAKFNKNNKETWIRDLNSNAYECLKGIDENMVLLNSPHFCKKVYYYLNPISEIK